MHCLIWVQARPCSVIVTACLYHRTVSCYIRPRYNSTLLYIRTLQSIFQSYSMVPCWHPILILLCLICLSPAYVRVHSVCWICGIDKWSGLTHAGFHISKIFHLPSFENFIFFKTLYDLEENCHNSLAQLAVLLVPGWCTMGYVVPC